MVRAGRGGNPVEVLLPAPREAGHLHRELPGEGSYLRRRRDPGGGTRSERASEAGAPPAIGNSVERARPRPSAWGAPAELSTPSPPTSSFCKPTIAVNCCSRTTRVANGALAGELRVWPAASVCCGRTTCIAKKPARVCRNDDASVAELSFIAGRGRAGTPISGIARAGAAARPPAPSARAPSPRRSAARTPDSPCTCRRAAW
jgi:hypothetical protein